MSRQRARERALPRSVRPHDRVHLAGVHREVHATEDLLILGPDFQITHFQHRHRFESVNLDGRSEDRPLQVEVRHVDPTPVLLRVSVSPWPLRSCVNPYPTEPSNEIPNSFCASTANSIGSSRKTSLQKPLTIMLMASSLAMPRCSQ